MDLIARLKRAFSRHDDTSQQDTFEAPAAPVADAFSPTPGLDRQIESEAADEAHDEEA